MQAHLSSQAFRAGISVAEDVFRNPYDYTRGREAIYEVSSATTAIGWYGAAGVPSPGRRAGGGAEKSNIVMLMTDDTGWNDFGAYSGGGAALGHPTPNLDRLAAEGAMFTSWYGQASCTAGRSSFITGRIPIRSALSIVVAPGDEN